MKKVLIKLMALTLILCLAVCALVACGGKDWKGTTMTDPGNLKSHGGFVAETDNYIYYINGVADSTADNTFGVPVKGALMAALKSDLAKTEVVVPKLFAATDYKSGLFIDGNYVYYGSPNTEKAGDGSIANSELKFMRTTLDGKSTDEFFTVSTLSAEYRIVKSGEIVYIVYYDAEESAIKSYDTTNETEIVVAKTDEKTDKNYSLASQSFIDTVDGGVAVVYTVNVYSEAYYESKAEQSGYTRATQSYNEIYAYKVGDAVDADTGLAGKKVLGDNDATFAIKLVKDGVVYYTQTPSVGAAKTYSVKVADLYDGKATTEIKNVDYVVDTNVIAGDEVYTFADGKIYKSSLTKDDKTSKTLVAKTDRVTTLLFEKDGYVYFVNTDTKIAKLKLNDIDAKEIQVSGDTVSTTWYSAEIVDGKLFYLDSSAIGASYVHYVSLDAGVDGDDTDDDGEIDSNLYLKGTAFIGQMIEKDKASVVAAKINDVANVLDNGVLPFEAVDGELTVGKVTEARAAYDALTEDSKAEFDEATLTALTNYEKAIEMANLYAKLDGMFGYKNMTTDEQTALKSAFEEVKSAIEDFRRSSDYSTISAYISNNAKANYQYAEQEFAAK